MREITEIARIQYFFLDQKPITVKNAVKIAAEDDGFVTYSELRENLKHSNFSDVEIDLYFDMFRWDIWLLYMTSK